MTIVFTTGKTPVVQTPVVPSIDWKVNTWYNHCLLYTSDAADE